MSDKRKFEEIENMVDDIFCNSCDTTASVNNAGDSTFTLDHLNNALDKLESI